MRVILPVHTGASKRTLYRTTSRYAHKRHEGDILLCTSAVQHPHACKPKKNTMGRKVYAGNAGVWKKRYASQGIMCATRLASINVVLITIAFLSTFRTWNGVCNGF